MDTSDLKPGDRVEVELSGDWYLTTNNSTTTATIVGDHLTFAGAKLIALDTRAKTAWTTQRTQFEDYEKATNTTIHPNQYWSAGGKQATKITRLIERAADAIKPGDRVEINGGNLGAATGVVVDNRDNLKLKDEWLKLQDEWLILLDEVPSQGCFGKIGDAPTEMASRFKAKAKVLNLKSDLKRLWATSKGIHTIRKLDPMPTQDIKPRVGDRYKDADGSFTITHVEDRSFAMVYDRDSRGTSECPAQDRTWAQKIGLTTTNTNWDGASLSYLETCTKLKPINNKAVKKGDRILLGISYNGKRDVVPATVLNEHETHDCGAAVLLDSKHACGGTDNPDGSGEASWEESDLLGAKKAIKSLGLRYAANKLTGLMPANWGGVDYSFEVLAIIAPTDLKRGDFVELINPTSGETELGVMLSEKQVACRYKQADAVKINEANKNVAIELGLEKPKYTLNLTDQVVRRVPKPISIESISIGDEIEFENPDGITRTGVVVDTDKDYPAAWVSEETASSSTAVPFQEWQIERLKLEGYETETIGKVKSITKKSTLPAAPKFDDLQVGDEITFGDSDTETITAGKVLFEYAGAYYVNVDDFVDEYSFSNAYWYFEMSKDDALKKKAKSAAKELGIDTDDIELLVGVSKNDIILERKATTAKAGATAMKSKDKPTPPSAKDLNIGDEIEMNDGRRGVLVSVPQISGYEMAVVWFDTGNTNSRGQWNKEDIQLTRMDAELVLHSVDRLKLDTSKGRCLSAVAPANISSVVKKAASAPAISHRLLAHGDRVRLTINGKVGAGTVVVVNDGRQKTTVAIDDGSFINYGRRGYELSGDLLTIVDLFSKEYGIDKATARYMDIENAHILEQLPRAERCLPPKASSAQAGTGQALDGASGVATLDGGAVVGTSERKTKPMKTKGSKGKQVSTYDLNVGDKVSFFDAEGDPATAIVVDTADDDGVVSLLIENSEDADQWTNQVNDYGNGSVILANMKRLDLKPTADECFAVIDDSDELTLVSKSKLKRIDPTKLKVGDRIAYKVDGIVANATVIVEGTDDRYVQIAFDKDAVPESSTNEYVGLVITDPNDWDESWNYEEQTVLMRGLLDYGFDPSEVIIAGVYDEDQDILEVLKPAKKVANRNLDVFDLERGDRVELRLHKPGKSKGKKVVGVYLADGHFWLDEAIEIKGYGSSISFDQTETDTEADDRLDDAANELDLDIDTEARLWAFNAHDTEIIKVVQRANAPKQKDKAMGTETEKSLWDTMKNDAAEAAYRTCADKMVEGVRNGMILAIKAKGGGGDKLAIAETALQSEYGKAFIATLLGQALPYVPGMQGDPRLVKMADEFRVSGMAIVMNEILGSMMDFVVPAIKDAMAGLPPLEAAEQKGVRVKAPPKLEAVEDHQEEAKTQAVGRR